MKHFLLVACFLLSTNLLKAQVWVGGGGDNLWNNAANWDTGSVPGTMDDVSIPGGFTVSMDNPGTDIRSLVIDATSTLNMLGGTFIFSTTFENNGTLNFTRPITGGGTVTNNGTINLTNTNGTLSSTSGATTLINNGDINLNDIGDLVIESNCVLTNQIGGQIFLNSNSTGIARSGSTPHLFNNFGSVISSPPMNTDQVLITAQIINNGGSFTVNNGILFLDSDSLGSEHNSGIYNTSAGASLRFNDTTKFSGFLTGANDGSVDFKDTMDINVSATINISGPGIINFDPTLIGMGTLINTTTLTIGAQPVFLNDNTTLLNQGTLEFLAAGDLLISSGSTLHNDVIGTIDFKGNTGNIQSGASGALPHSFLNNGLVTTNFTGGGTDSAQISADMINTGTFQVSNGTIFFFDDDIQLDGGIYNIGPGGTLDVDNTVTVSGSLTGSIDPTGLFKWNGRMIVPVAASFDFTGSEIIDWFNGSLDGGGTLTNNNIINIGSSANAFIFGMSTLINNDTINFNSNDDLLIETGGFLNNSPTGDINFFADGAQIGVNGVAPRVFVNNGDIIVNLPNPDDDVTILCEFNNNGANIEIVQGVLNLNNGTKDAQNLLGGVYNISSNGAFDWDNNVTLVGTLSGNIQGPINWRGSVWVNAPNTATFAFAGLEKILWSSGSLNGGGTLINGNKIDITATGTLFMRDGVNFRNEDEFTFTTFGDIQLETNGIFDNLVNGTVTWQQPGANVSTSGPAPHKFNNLGEFIFDSSGINSVAIDTDNEGLIDIRSGELDFNSTFVLTNETTGIIKGNGILDLPSPSNFINNGTIAPGNSPGTLTILGDYSSTSSAILEIEIDGITQGTEFDFIPITGDDVIFDGIVDVTLGFNANVNDEFIISTTSGMIMTCDIAPTASAFFGGNTYNFSVICRNGDELVLTVTEVLSVDDVELDESHLSMFPNPANDTVILKNTSNIDIESIIIYDVSGRLIVKDISSFTSEEKQINVQNLTEGLYFIKVNSSRGSVTKHLLVRR